MLLVCFSKTFQTSKNQIKVDLVDENFTELKGEIAGPPDTPYEGELSVSSDIQAPGSSFIFKGGLVNSPLHSAVHSK